MIPRVDIEETEKNYLITADLPGIKKEDLNVELNNGMLTIRAQHDETSEEKKEGVVKRNKFKIKIQLTFFYFIKIKIF